MIPHLNMPEGPVAPIWKTGWDRKARFRFYSESFGIHPYRLCGENKIWRLFSKFWRLRLIPEVSVQKIWNMFHMYFWIWKKYFNLWIYSFWLVTEKNSSLLCIPHHVFFVPSLSADLYPLTKCLIIFNFVNIVRFNYK